MNKIIGIDQGTTKMLMMAEWEGKIIDKVVPTGRSVTKSYLKHEIETFIKELPFKPEGIGMAVVGLVQDNRLKATDMDHLEGLTEEDLSYEGCPVYLVNDVKAAMICEEQFYKEETPFVLIMAGSGFAMSVRTQGVNILGQHGWAGELGSSPYPINGTIQKLDDIAGGLGILEKAGCDIETLLKALEQEEPFAMQVIEQAGFYFGLALANIIHTFNPKYIVVGGSCTKFKGYMAKATQTAKDYTLEEMFKCCEFVTPKDLKRIVALGAKRYGELEMAKNEGGKRNDITEQSPHESFGEKSKSLSTFCDPKHWGDDVEVIIRKDKYLEKVEEKLKQKKSKRWE